MNTEGQPIHDGSCAPTDLVRAHVMVSGEVQGVAYRAFTQRQARNLNIHGWVRNLPGGQVETEFEGTQTAVEALLIFLRQGPPLAHIEHMQVEWLTVLNDSKEFHIL